MQEQMTHAIEFSRGQRGKFIQAQALYYAIQKLSEVDGVMQEKSNIADMKYLLDYLHPGYEGIFDHIEQQRCTLQYGREVHNHAADPHHKVLNADTEFATNYAKWEKEHGNQNS